MRGTDVRRTGTDIVKKSNDHLEKQTAPNRPSRDSQTVESNHTEIDQPTVEDLSNASRNARDLTYDTVANDTLVSDDNTTAGIPLENDSVYSIVSNGEVTSNISVDKSAAKATVSSVILKNPKDNENKTKLDATSLVKKLINKQSKNATESISDKPKTFNVLNNTRDNSTDYVGDQFSLNETSRNDNVTEDTSKNITFCEYTYKRYTFYHFFFIINDHLQYTRRTLSVYKDESVDYFVYNTHQMAF